MTKQKPTTCSVLLQADLSDWIMIFPAGKVSTNDSRGPYTLADPAKVVAASKRPMVDLAIDRDHVMDLAQFGTEAVAAGWIKEMQARQDGVYARIEWTPKAKQQLDHKEYRYISPTFLHEKGHVTRILRASLTNDPNFEMPALAATDHQSLNPQETEMENQTLKAIAALLGLEEGAGEEAVLEAVTSLKNGLDAVKEEVDAPAEAAPEEVVNAVEAAIEKEVASRVAKKVTASSKQHQPDPSKYVPISAFEEVSNGLKKLLDERSHEKATAAVERATAAGKLTPGLKPWGYDLALNNMEAFERFEKNAPSITQASGRSGLKPDTAGSQGLDADDDIIMSKLGLTKEEYLDGQKS